MSSSPVPEVDGGLLGAVDRWFRAHPLGSDALLAMTLAAALGSLTLTSLRDMDVPSPWLGGVSFGTLHASVVVRRAATSVAYAIASAAMVGVVAAPNLETSETAQGVAAEVPMLFMPSSLVFLLLLYTAAVRLPRRLSTIALGVALAGAGLATIRIAGPLREAYAGSWQVVLIAAVGLLITILATWSLGQLAAVRRRRGEAARIEATRLAVLEERSRIARDMHDVVAHSIALIVRQAEGGSFVASRAPEQAAKTLRTIADTGRDALGNMRGLLGVLREPNAEGTPAGPEPSLAELPALLPPVRDAGLAVEHEQVGTPFDIGKAAELAAYRVVQEALTNSIKYAGRGAHVHITEEWSPTDFTVEIRDDGGGGHSDRAPIERAGAVPGARVGLRGLRERVTAAGGRFTAERFEAGFRVRATFPRHTVGGGQ